MQYLSSIQHLYMMSSLWMAVVILFVQCVHYPAFTFIEEKKLTTFSIFHQKRISFIVMPAMLIEAATLSYLTFVTKEPLFYISAILLALIWLSTFFIQVPTHNKLVTEPTQDLTKKLVQENIPRTCLWCFKAILICWYYYI